MYPTFNPITKFPIYRQKCNNCYYYVRKLHYLSQSHLFIFLILSSPYTRHGVRNSLLLAPMPTASTAQILGNNESIEPYTSNIYSRRVLSGEFQVVNHHLLKDLTERNLWDEAMKQKLIAYNGSIQVYKI